MRNRALAVDYMVRATKRLRVLDALYEQEAWADVVREAQEVVELAMKGFLRSLHIEVPAIHDVSPVLEQNQERLTKDILQALPRLTAISRTLRRDRELAFYGSEDLTPSEFYKKEDADEARLSARFVVEQLRPHVVG